MTAPLELPSYADVEPMDQEWLWEGRIPLGEVTVLAGDSGIGKGFLMADLAARVSRGDTMPDGSPGPEAGSVVMVTPEDDPECATVHRLKAAGALLPNVHDATETPEGTFELARDGTSVPYLRAVTAHLGDVRLVIIDPLSAVSAVSLGANVTIRRNIMRPLQGFAHETGAAVLIVHHTVKSGAIAANKGLVDAARSVLRVELDRDSGLRTLSVVKSNITGAGTPDVCYRVGGTWPDVTVRWAPGTVTGKPEPVTEPEVVPDASGYGMVVAAKPAVTDYQALILGVLRDLGPLGPQEIAARTGIGYGSVRVMCHRMEKRGQVVKAGRGVYEVAAAGLRIA